MGRAIVLLLSLAACMIHAEGQAGNTQAQSSGDLCLTDTTAPPTVASSTTSSVATSSSSLTTKAQDACTPFLNINAGSSLDRADLTVGKSAVYPSPPLVVTDDKDREVHYSSHRYGKDFSYAIPLAAGEYTVSLGFSEIWAPSCSVGKRVFSVQLNSIPVSELTHFDTYKAAGACTTPVVKLMHVSIPSTSGALTLRFIAEADNAFVSDISIYNGYVNNNGCPYIYPGTTSPATSQSTQTTQTSTQASTTSATYELLTSVNVAAGRTKLYLSDKSLSKVYTISSDVEIANTAEDAKFQAHRYGKEFEYLLPMAPGSYHVTLGFAETYAPNCVARKRIFAVSVNNKEVPELKNFDAFKQAGSCNRAVFVKVDTEVTELSGPMSLLFKAVTENAFISSIQVDRAVQQCIPVSTEGLTTENHRAHAVPGEYPPQLTADSPKSYIDTDGDGFERVVIDGTKSHSHFQDVSDPNYPITGEITRYKWTNIDTGAVLSTEPSFSALFPLGTTRLHLLVTDNTCDTAEAETTVSVTGSVKHGGSYCYFYTSASLPESGGAASASNKPFFASEGTSFNGVLETPPGMQSAVFSARCSFFYEVDVDSVVSLSILTDGTGKARLVKGTENILDNAISTSVETKLLKGLTEFEVLYLREDVTRSPTLSITVNGNAISPEKISFDRNTVLPILTSSSPESSSKDGGVRVQFTGHGFFVRPDVIFGDSALVQAELAEWTPTSFFVTTPKFAAGSTIVRATTAQGGISNSLPFYFESESADPVLFSRLTVQKPNKTPFSVVSTCIAVWGDAWYLGLFGGSVMKLKVDATMTVTSQCISGALVDKTVLAPNSSTPAKVDILGIAFSPLDTVGRPYVSVNTLFWFDRDVVDQSNNAAWRNGRIERLKPGGTCLVLDEHIVSGLPVSDHDHGVNGLAFDQYGDMYASVGGFTNMGLPGAGLGNQWENPLSGSIVKVLLSKGSSFDGHITYDQDLPNIKRARKLSGDVEMYATGIRNAYDICFTSKSEMYATDNGPNRGFGDAATNCKEDDLDSFEGNNNVVGVPSFDRPDKVMKIEKGAWYGHPNLNRGECQYIDPFTGRDAKGNNPDPSLNYHKQIATLKSSIDGICEYTASHFGDQLKGNIIISSYAPSGVGIVYRMKPGETPIALDLEWSGLSVAQGYWGELVFPRVNKKVINILQPNYPFPSALSVRVVTPFRGPKTGGLSVVITGHGFGHGSPVVLLDGNKCSVNPTSVQETARGSILKCVTPPSNGKELVDVSVSIDGQTSTIKNGFMYTAV